MAIETHSVRTWKGATADGHEPAQQLLDALQSFAKSRATRQLIRQAEEGQVHLELRVPFLDDCPVRAQELSRALRKLQREVIDAAEPGARFIIDFYMDAESRLVMQAARQA